MDTTETVKLLFSTIAILSAFGWASCSNADPDQSVDLDRALSAFDLIMKRIDEEMGASDKKREPKAEIKPITSDNPEWNDYFFVQLAKELNRQELISDPLGIQIGKDGAIEGFLDFNEDGMRQRPKDRLMFAITIEIEQGRLIAKDEANGRMRVLSYQEAFETRRYNGSGQFMEYLLGRMLQRQKAARRVRSSFGDSPRSAPNDASQRSE